MVTWNMALKRISASLMAFILLLSLAACGEAEEEGPPEVTDSLVVYAGPYVADFLGSAVRRFNTLYPDVEVTIRDFGNADEYQNEENYIEVLKSELAAGAGPDLLLFTSDEFDVQKTVESGTFQDLSGYVEADPDFNQGDYNTVVMDAGVIDGQRLFVPISYTVDLLLTTQTALAQVNQELPSNFEDWCRQMSGYGQTYRDDTGRFFTQYYDLFPYLLRASGLSIVDYTAKEVTADSDDFRSLIDAYKELYEMEWGRSEEGIYAKGPSFSYFGEDVQFVESGKILYSAEFYQYNFLFDYAGLLSDQTPVYAAFPSVTGKPTATITLSAAVNSNGENKRNAFYLLEVMLSEGMQSYGYTEFCYYYDIPVRNGVLKDCQEDQNSRMARQGAETPYGTVWFASVPDGTIDDIVSLVTGVTCCYISGPVQNFIWDEMQPYFEGQKSYEECLASLENKLELYINE